MVSIDPITTQNKLGDDGLESRFSIGHYMVSQAVPICLPCHWSLDPNGLKVSTSQGTPDCLWGRRGWAPTPPSLLNLSAVLLQNTGVYFLRATAAYPPVGQPAHTA
jgi:hypothetical protein